MQALASGAERRRSRKEIQALLQRAHAEEVHAGDLETEGLYRDAVAAFQSAIKVCEEAAEKAVACKLKVLGDTALQRIERLKKAVVHIQNTYLSTKSNVSGAGDRAAGGSDLTKSMKMSMQRAAEALKVDNKPEAQQVRRRRASLGERNRRGSRQADLKNRDRQAAQEAVRLAREANIQKQREFQQEKVSRLSIEVGQREARSHATQLLSSLGPGVPGVDGSAKRASSLGSTDFRSKFGMGEPGASASPPSAGVARATNGGTYQGRRFVTKTGGNTSTGGGENGVSAAHIEETSFESTFTPAQKRESASQQASSVLVSKSAAELEAEALVAAVVSSGSPSPAKLPSAMSMPSGGGTGGLPPVNMQ